MDDIFLIFPYPYTVLIIKLCWQLLLQLLSNLTWLGIKTFSTSDIETFPLFTLYS